MCAGGHASERRDRHGDAPDAAATFGSHSEYGPVYRIDVTDA